MTRADKLERLDASIERCQRKMIRAANALTKLLRQRKRLESIGRRPEPAPKGGQAVQPTVPPASPCGGLPPSHHRIEAARETPPVIAGSPAPSNELEIPGFLKRGQPNAADEAAKAEILAEREEHKKQRAAAQAATRKAKLRGELRKRPLEGKAALAHIREA